MFWYKYKVIWYDDGDVISYGITYGATYNEAVSHIVEDFGESNISSITLVALESGETFPISSGQYATIDEEVLVCYPVEEKGEN